MKKIPVTGYCSDTQLPIVLPSNQSDLKERGC